MQLMTSLLSWKRIRTMLVAPTKKRVDMGGYVSDRVFSGKRPLSPDQAKAHRQRVQDALKKQRDGAASHDYDQRKRA